MLNFDEKDKAIERLKRAAERYAAAGNVAQEEAMKLFELRKRTSDAVIRAAESYVSYLANSPREFEKIVSEFRIALDRFDGVVLAVQAEAHDVTVKGGVSTAVSVGSGVAVATVAPTAAMAIATTFGTASTGTAISALSGAAATNAALAWLGGGALAAGGGGMAAGQALLALAGPVGWTLGGLALIGTGFWVHNENAKIASVATDQAFEIEKKQRALDAAREEIAQIMTLTDKHAKGALEQLSRLRTQAPTDYRKFDTASKQELAALINNIQALGKLLNKQLA